MKKLFSNVQTLKSSEDCKKYSKSVSYKTLAIGATAIGSGATDNYSFKNGPYNSPWSDYRNDIFSVDISGISTIGTGAFGFLPNLKNVYMVEVV